MAYRRTTRARGRSTQRRSFGSRSGYSRPRTRTAARSRGRGGSNRGRSRPQEVVLRIEGLPASPVSRPGSYLSALNPAIVDRGLPKKAKL